MTRSSITLALAVAALAFDAPPAVARAGAQQVPATSSSAAAMPAVVEPGSRVAVQQPVAGR